MVLADTPADREQIGACPMRFDRGVASATGLTVREVARRYRVGEDKVRAWIRRGELRAINTAASTCARPRFVVPAEALSEFEQRRSAAAPKPTRKRRRRVEEIDYFP